MSIRLLVTADDFGAGPGRNAGILHAWQNGIVTGATLLANGPACVEATQLALHYGLPVGVHLNLADGRPLTEPIAGLCGITGQFPGKARLRQVLHSGEFDRAGVKNELLAQIAAVRAAGLEPTHLDTHQHFLLFPSITPLLVEVALTAGIDRMRRPLPMETAQDDPGDELGAELALYRQLAPQVVATLSAARVRTPDGLYGMQLLNRLDLPALERLLTSLPSGTWELMTHPGFTDPDCHFSGTPREIEVASLTAPHLPQLLVERHIQLLDFSALG